MAAFYRHQDLRRDYSGMFKKDGSQASKFNLCPKSSAPSLRRLFMQQNGTSCFLGDHVKLRRLLHSTLGGGWGKRTWSRKVF